MKAIRFSAWLYIFIVPIYFGVADKAGIMAASILAGCLILAFSYINKIKKFKGAGFEAELRDAVNEAYATIEKLQDIAVNLSEPIITEVTMQNRLTSYIPLKYRLEQIKDIEGSLRELGIEEKKIDKTTEFFYSAFQEDHIIKIAHAVIKDPKANEAVKKIMEDYKEREIPEEKSISEVLSSHEYTPTNEIAELIKDAEYFYKEKSFRRLDTWQ